MSGDSFSGSNAIVEMLRQQERIRDIVDPPALRAMREAEERMRDLIDPPALRAMRLAQERIRDMVDPPAMRAMRLARERIRDLVDPPAMRAVRDAMDAIHRCSLPNATERTGLAFRLGASTSLASMTAFARSSQLFSLGTTVIETALRHGHMEGQASRAALAAAGISKLASQNSDANFQPSAELTAAGVEFLTPAFDDGTAVLVAEMPLEVFRALDLDAALPGSAQDLAKDERAGIASATSDELEATLVGVDPELLVLLKGARAATRSENPDKARHVCVSLRELLGHVLRQLAPDAQVVAWTKDPEHFHEGRPTRKARIHYLYDAVAEPALKKFIAADIRAALELFDALSAGTHVANLGASAVALTILLHRAEGVLLLLLRLSSCRH